MCGHQCVVVLGNLCSLHCHLGITCFELCVMETTYLVFNPSYGIA